MKKPAEQLRRLLPPNAQSSEVLEPRDRTFDGPSPIVAAKRSTILRKVRYLAVGPMWRNHLDALLREFLVKTITVVRLVADHARRNFLGQHEIEKALHKPALVWACRGRVDGHRRVVAVSESGVVTDTALSVSSGGVSPTNVTVSPNGRRALVANFGSNAVGVLGIAGDTVTFLDAIALEAGAQSIAFTPNGASAYVFHESSGVVSGLSIDENDNVTDSGIRVSGVGTAPAYFGVDQIAITGGANVLVHSNTLVTIIDTSTNTITGDIPLAGDSQAGGIAAIP